MPQRSPEELLARSERAWEMKRRWYSIFWEAWQYAAPGLNPYGTSYDAEYAQAMHAPSHVAYSYLFDGTVARACERVPHRITEEAFTPGQHWANMQAGPLMAAPDLPKKDVIQAIQLSQMRLFAHLNAAPLLLELVKMIRDAYVSGTGCMKVGMAPDSSSMLHVEAVNQAQVALEAGPMGTVWGFYRKAEMPREHVLATWPDAKGVPEDPVNQDPKAEPPKLQLAECTYYDPTSGLWYHDVIVEKGAHASEHRRVVERELPVCPWICYRYSLLAGEVQGRSPVMAALPDARVLNHAKQVRLESASLRVAGMFTYRNDATFNPRTVRLRSGAFIPVGSNDRQDPTIRPLEVSGDVQLGELIIEGQVMALRESLLDETLPDPSGAVRSATEFIERRAEARQRRGLPYLRLMHEVARPLLRASTWHLSEAGQLPELALITETMDDGRPRPLMLDGTDLQVQFTSPHVQAHNLSEARTIVEWGEAAKLTAGEAAFQAGAKVEDIPEILAEKMKVSVEVWRSKEEREERMAAAVAAEQAQGAGQPALPGPGAGGGILEGMAV